MDTNSLPVTWPELLRHDHDLLQEGLELIDEVPDQLLAVRSPWLPANEFGGPSLTLAQAVVVLGPETCDDAFHTLVPLVPTVMRDFANGVTTDTRVPAQQLLSFFNTARCTGVALPDSAVAAESAWIDPLARFVRLMTEAERQTLALAALVVDEQALVPSIVGGGALEESVLPGETFGFNAQGFIRYLAAARRDGTRFMSVEPAWREFVERFPYKRAAGTLDWPDLLYAARVVQHVRGAPDGETVDTLRATIDEVA